jgi:hypothetical protein
MLLQGGGGEDCRRLRGPEDLPCLIIRGTLTVRGFEVAGQGAASGIGREGSSGFLATGKTAPLLPFTLGTTCLVMSFPRGMESWMWGSVLGTAARRIPRSKFEWLWFRSLFGGPGRCR